MLKLLWQGPYRLKIKNRRKRDLEFGKEGGERGLVLGGGRGREGLKFWEERFQAGLVWGLSIDIWIFQLPFKHFPFRRSTNKVFIIWIFPDIKLRCYVRLCNFHIYWEKYPLTNVNQPWSSGGCRQCWSPGRACWRERTGGCRRARY